MLTKNPKTKQNKNKTYHPKKGNKKCNRLVCHKNMVCHKIYHKECNGKICPEKVLVSYAIKI